MPNPVVATVAACLLAVYACLALAFLKTYRDSRMAGYLVLGAGIVAWPTAIWLLSGAFYLAGWSLPGGTMPVLSAVVNQRIASVGELTAIVRFGLLAAQGVLILVGLWMIAPRQSVQHAR
jgi:hypothetical protein